jgi:hypothetical protein
METANLAHQQELEEFGRLFFKYTQLVEDNACVIRNLPEELTAPAHARVTERTLQEQQGNLPNHLRTPEQIQLDLKTLAAQCEITPTTLDECVLYYILLVEVFSYSFAIYPVAFISQTVP